MSSLFKKIIKLSVFGFARFCYYAYPHNLNMKVLSLRDLFYTGWIESGFQLRGRNIHIEYPLYLKGEKYISLGNGVNLKKRTRIEAWNKYGNCIFYPQIIIGDNVSIGNDCHIGCIDKIIIGDNVLMGSKIYISDHSHGRNSIDELSIPPVNRNLYSKGPVIIKDNVWIGENVVILPNVIIGCNSVIGANSVVTKDIPENCVAGGNPAKIIKFINI